MQTHTHSHTHTHTHTSMPVTSFPCFEFFTSLFLPSQVLAQGDVYVTTVTTALDWIRNPTSLKDIKRLSSWRCGRGSRLKSEKKKKTKTSLYSSEVADEAFRPATHQLGANEVYR